MKPVNLQLHAPFAARAVHCCNYSALIDLQRTKIDIRVSG